MLVTQCIGIGWRTVAWNMKECVCLCDWQVNGTVSLPRPSFLYFPHSFLTWPDTCFFFYPPCSNSHISSVPNASTNIWVKFCRCHWERCVCTSRAFILTSQMLNLCWSLDKIHMVLWEALESRTWTCKTPANTCFHIVQWTQRNIHTLSCINIIVDDK